MITTEDLGEALDQVSPFALNCGYHYEDGQILFGHPTWDDVFCKFGWTEPRPKRPKRRMLCIWMWVERGDEDFLHMLTVREATVNEQVLLESITRGVGPS